MITWNNFFVTVQCINRIIGSIPLAFDDKDERLKTYQGWLKGQGVEDSDKFEKSLAEALVEDNDMPVVEDGSALDEGMINGFRRDDKGLYIEARVIKANLREAAQRLGIINMKRGSRQVLQHDIHVRNKDDDRSQKIYLGRTEPDGFGAMPISVMTPKGRRNAIKRFEFVLQPELQFKIRMLAGGQGKNILSVEDLANMLTLGGDLGYGADRSQGEGCYELVSIEQLDDTTAEATIITQE